MLEENQIHLGDSFDLLEKVEDNSVDLIVCDGPYGIMPFEWDQIESIQEYNLKLIERLAPKLKKGAALYLFGKADCLDFVDYRKYLNLRSKIVWFQPSRLSQGRLNFTNNYDLIYYFIKGNKPAQFNLDDIRVPHLVELTQRRRCENVPSVKTGKFEKTKFNDKGKNCGNVWGDIKGLTYKSKELVCREALNTVQKPEKLIERIVLASSSKGDLVLDPFSGVGTCAAVCKKLGRRFLSFEMNEDFVKMSNERLEKISLT